jgi:oxepin-CoA hydrolase/3-oxo-5,6-dehydrosuberyl-CoA semialdehyde dehydrogenase
VRARIAELRGEAELVHGDPERVDILSGDAEAGAFLNPVLLYCDRPESGAAVHDVEAFGPVSTVLPYDGLDDAVALARRGKGSLVASVFTDDPDFARDAVAGLAPWHGRILINNRTSAKASTGHGSPLPLLIHGGPGRAGGGEELGGIRAVKHFMQRCALQGSPDMLTRAAGRWIRGAGVRAQLLTESRTVTLEDIEYFAEFTGDTFYAHMDEAAAKANPFFDGRVAHGYFIVSAAAGLFVQPDPGPVLANYGIDELRFMTPVYPGDSIRVALTCKEITAREGAEYGEVRWDSTVTNQEARVVAQYDVLTLVAKTWP